jgi:hypothetical protein
MIQNAMSHNNRELICGYNQENMHPIGVWTGRYYPIHVHNVINVNGWMIASYIRLPQPRNSHYSNARFYFDFAGVQIKANLDNKAMALRRIETISNSSGFAFHFKFLQGSKDNPLGISFLM